MKLAGKTAIVTGGAWGMGAVTAELLASEGADVVIADILEEEGRSQAEKIAADGGKASFHRLDVTEDSGWAGLAAARPEAGILVNNAGISGSGYADPFDLDAWNSLMAINVTGAFLGCRHFVPKMAAAGGGVIVNISSISGVVGQDVVHHGYNASKGAIRVLTKSLAVRHAPEGIRANSVHPGLMPPMRTSGATADPAVRERMLRRVPMGRNGRADEVAKAVLFLASDDSSYCSGVELYVDGGFLAS